MTVVSPQSGDIPQWTVGDRLRKARERTGYTQGDFADLIGISKRSVTSAERGEHQPRRIVLNAWSLATGVPVAWLQSGDIAVDRHSHAECAGCAIRDSNPEPADLWPLPEWVTAVDPNGWIVLDYPRAALNRANTA